MFFAFFAFILTYPSSILRRLDIFVEFYLKQAKKLVLAVFYGRNSYLVTYKYFLPGKLVDNLLGLVQAKFDFTAVIST